MHPYPPRYPHYVDYLRLSVLLPLLALLGGCGAGTQPADKTIFRMNLTVAPASLDPAFARDQTMGWLTAQLYNGLVALGPDLQPQPALARSWQISADGLTYTFHLRTDVFFHENEVFGEKKTRALTAWDVAFSFTRIADPATASPGQWLFSTHVAGVAAYRQKQAATITGFSIVNDSTFQVLLTRRFSPFLSLLAMPYAYIVPQEAIRRWGKDFRTHPLGTGPFTFKRWDAGQELILLRNPHYFERGLPRLGAVEVRFNPSRLIAFEELLRGRLDFIEGLDPTLKDELFTPDGKLQPAYRGRIQLLTGPQLTTEYLGFGLTQKGNPLQYLRLRQAISYAIDRPRLVRYLRNSLALPATGGIVPLGLPGFDSLQTYGYYYNPAKARALLAAAGYPGGRGLKPLSLLCTPGTQTLGEFVQASLSEVGIPLEIDAMEGAATREAIANGQAPCWRASWVADYPDAENFLSLFTTANLAPAGPNYTRFSSPGYDSLYTKALATTDPRLKFALYHRMEHYLLTQAPAVFLFYYQTVRLVGMDVLGLTTNPMDAVLDLRRLERKR